MRQVEATRLSREGFAPYGAYANMTEPAGVKIGAEPIEFFRDMIQAQMGSGPAASFSVCRVAKRPFIVDVSEYHDSCCEVALPLDGDVLMHVAPAVPDKEFPFDQAQVFLVPRGTLCCLRPGVWHHAPFALQAEAVSCLIVLPERTYMNDCTVCEIPAEHRIGISLQSILK